MPSLRRALSDRRRARDRSVLGQDARLGLVLDAGWYATRYRDVFRVGSDPVEHFLRSGIGEGRDPGPFVDLAFYAAQASRPFHPAPALLAHLLDVGIPTGIRTSPYLDLDWYAAEEGCTEASPLERLGLLIVGVTEERRSPSPFIDLVWYATRYRDISAGGLDPFAYFVALGGQLGRYPHPLWDEHSYRADNEYVRFALGMGKYLHGFEHFCAVGHDEVVGGSATLIVRIDDAEEYSEERYLAANPDVAVSVASGAVRSGLVHLFSRGHEEVRRGERRLQPPSSRARIAAGSGHRSPAADTLVVLVHFDPEGELDPHVLLAIDAYVEAGIDVCAVTVGLDEDREQPLRDRCVAVLRRDENDGLRDFGAWSVALEALGDELLDRYERVVLANDSAYFPVRDAQEFLSALRSQTCDLWGASDSLSGGRYHLQSYFLALSRKGRSVIVPELARRAEAWPSPTKLMLIQRFEVGLTQYALEQGLEVGAFRSVKDLAAATGGASELLSPPDPRVLSSLVLTITNQTHHFWRALIRSGLPFLKVELLRDNPLSVDLSGWQEELTDAPCSATSILRHLDRVASSGWAGRPPG